MSFRMNIGARVLIVAISLAIAGCAPERRTIVIDAPRTETVARATVPRPPPCPSCQVVVIPAGPDWVMPVLAWAPGPGFGAKGDIRSAALPPTPGTLPALRAAVPDAP